MAFVLTARDGALFVLGAYLTVVNVIVVKRIQNWHFGEGRIRVLSFVV
jgi:hypothetical protein